MNASVKNRSVTNVVFFERCGTSGLLSYETWVQFCYKMWRGQLDIKPIKSSGLCGSEIM